ncbi:MAG: glycosyltransferase family 4 protein [Parabacteroides sp.]|nr:glycosyltransferase family 4 protein [Parabacteroides sp.]
MSRKPKIIFIGAVNCGHPADDGETVKNRILIDVLRKQAGDVSIIDVRNRPARICYLLKFVCLLLFAPERPIVLSASSWVTYRLLKVIRLFGRKRSIFYWVIGGRFDSLIADKKLDSRLYTSLTRIIVEGESMRATLKTCGLYNVVTVPNFKKITYIPSKRPADCCRFVFLSRIIPEKGVDLILDAAERLNASDGGNFGVDFYGKIAPGYEPEFLSRVGQLPQVAYRGFLDLTTHAGYDILAGYSAMLFPTFWPGEGFPGIIVDACIAGLPVIASDWNLNKYIITTGYNGILIPPKDAGSLAQTMRRMISGEINLENMAANAQKECINYNADTLLTRALLRRIGIL